MRKNNIFFIIVPIILSINFLLGTEIAAIVRDTNSNKHKSNEQTTPQQSVKSYSNRKDKVINAKHDNLAPQSKQIESQIGEMKNQIKILFVIVYILGLIIFVVLVLFFYNFYLPVNISNKNVNNQSNHDNKPKFIDIEHFQIELNEISKQFKKFDEQLTELKLGYQNRNNENYKSTYTDVITTQSVKPIKEASYPKKTVKTNLYSPPSISNSDSNLLLAYNLDSRSLSTRTITVSESDHTAEQRRLGRSVSPILEFDSRGSYWILKEGNNEYLFPKANLKINEHNYNTIATFFECVGYQPGALNNFTVVKLAKVSSIDERWELRETGQLNFYQ